MSAPIDVWRTTGDDADNPQPNIWPECPTCSTPYTWKRFLSFKTGSYVWAWAKDCKHIAAAVLMTADGPYEAAVQATGEPG